MNFILKENLEKFKKPKWLFILLTASIIFAVATLSLITLGGVNITIGVILITVSALVFFISSKSYLLILLAVLPVLELNVFISRSSSFFLGTEDLSILSVVYLKLILLTICFVVSRKGKQVKKLSIFKPLVIFSIFILLNLIVLSPNHWFGLRQLLRLFGWLSLILLVAGHVRKREDINYLLIAALCGLTFPLLGAVWSLVTGARTGLLLGAGYGVYEISGWYPVGHSLPKILFSLFPWVVFAFFISKKKNSLYYFLLISVLLVSILYCYSRTAWVGVFVFLFVFLFLGTMCKRKKYIYFSLSLFAILIVFVFVNFGSVVQRSPDIITPYFFSKLAEVSSNEGRFLDQRVTMLSKNHVEDLNELQLGTVVAQSVIGQTLGIETDNNHRLQADLITELRGSDESFNRVIVYYNYDESGEYKDNNFADAVTVTPTYLQLPNGELNDFKTMVVMSKEIRTLTYTTTSNITGVTIYHVSSTNDVGIGDGTLQYNRATNTLTWRAPSGVAGRPITLYKDGKFQVFDTDRAKFASVLVNMANLPETDQTDIVEMAVLDGQTQAITLATEVLWQSKSLIASDSSEVDINHFVFVPFMLKNEMTRYATSISEVGSGRIGVWLVLLNKWVDSSYFNKIFGHGIVVVPEILGQDYGAHNDYIDLLIETGLVGLLLYSWILITILKELFLFLKKATGNYCLSLAYCSLALFVAFISMSLFEAHAYAQVPQLYIAAFMGIALGASKNLLYYGDEQQN